MIDWECGMLTKEDSPLNSRGYCWLQARKHPEWKERIEKEALPILDKLGVTKCYNRDTDETWEY